MKKVNELLSAALSIIIVLSVFSINAFAAKHTSNLTKNDFNYANGSDYYGNTNYVDTVADHTGFYVYENKHNKDYD